MVWAPWWKRRSWAPPAVADQQGHAAGGADDEQGVQQRQVARLGGQRPPDDRPQPVPGPLGRHPAWSQVSTVWESQASASRGRPGRLQRHRGGHGVQLADGLAHGDRAHRVAAVGELAVEAVGPAVAELGVQALLVARVGGDADALGEGGDAVLGRADPLAAVVDRGAVGRGQGQGPPADPFPGLQHHHLGPGVHQPAGGGQPGQAGPDHDDVCCGGQHTLLARVAGRTPRRWRSGKYGLRAPSGMEPTYEFGTDPFGDRFVVAAEWLQVNWGRGRGTAMAMTTARATSVRTFDSTSPATGEVVGTFPLDGPEQVAAAVARAREAARRLGRAGLRRPPAGPAGLQGAAGPPDRRAGRPCPPRERQARRPTPSSRSC